MSLLNLLIIGHGSQAKAWSKNIKKSGAKVTIALRPGSKNISHAKAEGYSVIDIHKFESIDHNFDAAIILTPDHTHHLIVEEISKNITGHFRVIYAHGFSMEKEKLHQRFPSISHLLLAPKAIASEVTSLYQQSKPVPAAFSLEYSLDPVKDMEILHKIAKSVGMTGRLIQTTFKEETICDLFSEQSLLCSTIPLLIKKSYDSLVAAGISPELAFLECCLESKYILNTLMQVGFGRFFEIISPNALIGAHKANEKLFQGDFFSNLDDLLKDIIEERFYSEIDHANIDTLREKMVSLYTEGDLESTRKSLYEYLG